MQVAVVHDLEEDVRGVRAVGEIAHLVDDEDVGMGVSGDGLPQLAGASGAGQIVDQVGGRGEQGVEAVPDRPVGDGDGQVIFYRSSSADVTAAGPTAVRRRRC
jgi:hypothetical protein